MIVFRSPLSHRSRTVVLSRAVTVAEGVFAPGHLGELTRQLPFELVDDVLQSTRTTQSRLRLLPSRVGVYFILALALFPMLGMPGYGTSWSQASTGCPCAGRQRRHCEMSAAGLVQPRSSCCSPLSRGPSLGRTFRGCATGVGEPSRSMDAARPRHPTDREQSPGWGRSSTASAKTDTRC